MPLIRVNVSLFNVNISFRMILGCPTHTVCVRFSADYGACAEHPDAELRSLSDTLCYARHMGAARIDRTHRTGASPGDHRRPKRRQRQHRFHTNGVLIVHRKRKSAGCGNDTVWSSLWSRRLAAEDTYRKHRTRAGPSEDGGGHQVSSHP